MGSMTHLIYKDNVIFLHGTLNFGNVMSIYQQSLAYIQQMTEVNIDFAHLQTTNSAGLVLIIEWIKTARKLHKTIHFFHLPTKLMAIAEIAGVDCLIG